MRPLFEIWLTFSNIEGRVGNSRNFTQNSLCFSYLGPPVDVLANLSMRFECSGTNLFCIILISQKLDRFTDLKMVQLFKNMITKNMIKLTYIRVAYWPHCQYSKVRDNQCKSANPTHSAWSSTKNWWDGYKATKSSRAAVPNLFVLTYPQTEKQKLVYP